MRLPGAVRLSARFLAWSTGRFAMPVALGFEAVVLMSRTDQWRGEWAWTIDWIGGVVVLLGPFVAALCAWRAVAIRDLLGELGDVVRPGRALTAELGGVVGWAWFAHACGLCVGLVLTAADGARGLPDLWPVVPQFAALAGYAGLGLLLGMLVPNPLIGPLTGVTLLFAVTQFSSSTLPSLWVYVGGATSSLVGLRYNPAVLLAQTLLGLGLAMAAFVVVRPWRGRVRIRWSAAPALLAIALPAAWLATNPDHYLPDDAAIARSCVGTAPTVCMLEASAASGPAVQSAFEALTVYARSIGVDAVPDRFDQTVAMQPRDRARLFVLNPGAVVGDHYAPEQASHYFVYDNRCLRGSPPPPSAIDGLELLAKHLAVGARLVSATQLADPALSALLAMPEQQRDRWAATALRASWSCDFGRVAMPREGR